MDTTPFHLILFALDIIVLGGLFLWIRSRRNTGRGAVHRPTLTWDITGVILFGGFGLICFAVLALLLFTNFVQERIYRFNVGQCIVEGIALHGTLFLIVAGSLLFWNRRRFSAVFFGCCALFLAAFSFNVLYWEPYHLRVEHYEIRTTKLTKPLRIVFVSDIQTDRIGFHEINTLKKIQAQNADLIILGGDYVQTFAGTRDKHLSENFRQMLFDHPLEAPLGVFAIAGNIREHGEVNDATLFRDTGIQYVWYTKVFYDLGADEGWEPPIDLVLLSTQRSITGFDVRDAATLANSSNFTIMAGHFPNYAVDGYADPNDCIPGITRVGFRNTERAPDLMLAGHTHGGQIVLPFYGPVPWGRDQYILQVPRTMWSGFFAYPNGGHLLVTRGTGLERGWSPRVRLFCPAEISVIDIIPE